jgi:hypothetical protein
MRRPGRASPVPLLLCLVGCGSGGAAPDLVTVADARANDARRLDGADHGARDAGKATSCAATFGNALTNAFGRLDGTVLAIVAPWDTQCPQPNNDHLILQVTMNGAAYRMVLNVKSTLAGADPRVLHAVVQNTLPGGAWSEGWHTGVKLDYPNMLGVDIRDFAPYPMNDLVHQVSDRITLGEKVSVFATSAGGTKADSAHLIHRNGGNTDGAIVLDPTSQNARFLLFAFAEQSF